MFSAQGLASEEHWHDWQEGKSEDSRPTTGHTVVQVDPTSLQWVSSLFSRHLFPTLIFHEKAWIIRDTEIPIFFYVASQIISSCSSQLCSLFLEAALSLKCKDVLSLCSWWQCLYIRLYDKELFPWRLLEIHTHFVLNRKNSVLEVKQNYIRNKLY